MDPWPTPALRAGSAACFCDQCGRLFTTVTAFDQHRVGDFEPVNTRRCLTDRELQRRGLSVGERGAWISRSATLLKTRRLPGF